MRRAVAAVLVLLPGAAFGQSYQTALPLSPAEKVALEARLSTVLDYAGSGESTNIVLPTGRVANVRTYQLVRQDGQTRCRGYRIDLQGRNGRTAVDGFRCRQSAGAWTIAEPEIVVAQEGAPVRPADEAVVVEEGGPLDLRGGRPLGNEVTVVVPEETSPDLVPRRLPDEPLYPLDDTGFGASAPPALPPVPRPAPRGELLAAAPSTFPPSTSAPSTFAPGAVEEEFAPIPLRDEPVPEDLADTLAPEPEETVPETLADTPAAEPEETVPETLADTPAPEPEETVREILADTPAPEPEEPAPAETTVASAGDATSVIAATPRVSRTVGTREERSFPDYVTDERVTTALEDLNYLDPAAAGAPEAVAAAVDEFARDERFVLPLSADALMERLAAALDRSEAMAACGPGDSPVCVAR